MRKQTRRSVSIRRECYERLLAHCRSLGISQSSCVEAWVSEFTDALAVAPDPNQVDLFAATPVQPVAAQAEEPEPPKPRKTLSKGVPVEADQPKRATIDEGVPPANLLL